MHELSVTESILKIALDHASKANAARIVAINLVIGDLSSMVDDSIQFYWDVIAKDTIAEGARLRFRRVPVEFQCRSCSERFRPVGEEFSCPKCGSFSLKVITGEEFFVEAIDVEE